MTEISSNVVGLENLTIGLERELAENTRYKRRTLAVRWNKKQGKLYYKIFSPKPEEHSDGWLQTGAPEEYQQITAFWEGLSQTLEDIARRGDSPREIRDSILISLQNQGQYLLNKLIPSEVAKCVENWQAGFTVCIETDETWIPWELIYDCHGFWSKRFILARLPFLSEEEQKKRKQNRIENKEIKQISQITNIVGGNLVSNIKGKAENLFNSSLLSSVNITTLIEQPYSVLLNSPEQVDVLHLTCHGYWKPKALLQIAKDQADTQNLTLEKVEHLKLSPGSLVFANACTSTNPTLNSGGSSFPRLTLKGFNNFGWEFYLQGTRVFIGTIGEIPQKHICDFANIIYRALFSNKRQRTIGMAVALAKRVFREKHLCWLFYCIYGDPYFSLNAP